MKHCAPQDRLAPPTGPHLCSENNGCKIGQAQCACPQEVLWLNINLVCPSSVKQLFETLQVTGECWGQTGRLNGSNTTSVSQSNTRLAQFNWWEPIKTFNDSTNFLPGQEGLSGILPVHASSRGQAGDYSEGASGSGFCWLSKNLRKSIICWVGELVNWRHWIYYAVIGLDLLQSTLRKMCSGCMPYIQTVPSCA